MKIELSLEEAMIVKSLLIQEEIRVEKDCEGNEPMRERNLPYLESLESILKMIIRTELS